MYIVRDRYGFMVRTFPTEKEARLWKSVYGGPGYYISQKMYEKNIY